MPSDSKIRLVLTCVSTCSNLQCEMDTVWNYAFCDHDVVKGKSEPFDRWRTNRIVFLSLFLTIYCFALSCVQCVLVEGTGTSFTGC